jgi:hypothetical protein
MAESTKGRYKDRVRRDANVVIDANKRKDIFVLELAPHISFTYKPL